jgi:hypothetical protein
MMAPRPAATSISGENLVIDVPQNAGSLTATVWDRFGNRVELLSERNPGAGRRSIRWNPDDPRLAQLLGNAGILRIAMDDTVESHLVRIGRVQF